jgi:hypothetical protein
MDRASSANKVAFKDKLFCAKDAHGIGRVVDVFSPADSLTDTDQITH